MWKKHFEPLPDLKCIYATYHSCYQTLTHWCQEISIRIFNINFSKQIVFVSGKFCRFSSGFSDVAVQFMGSDGKWSLLFPWQEVSFIVTWIKKFLILEHVATVAVIVEVSVLSAIDGSFWYDKGIRAKLRKEERNQNERENQRGKTESCIIASVA